MTSLRAGRSGF